MPRAATSPRVAALVLAAGSSRRMQGQNKLLADIAGKPLVAHAVDAVLGSRACDVVVVTGYRADAVRSALTTRRGLRFAHNAHFRLGMSASLRIGVAVLAPRIDAVLLCLGDLPRLRAMHVDRVLGAFVPGAERDICVPVCGSRRGHPVLLPRRCFARLLQLHGDTGAREILRAEASRVRTVTFDDDAVIRDVDTPEALADARAGPEALADARAQGKP